MARQSRLVREGAYRVWRYQRLVWWFFVVNLLLAWFAGVPLKARLNHVTGHSLNSERLINGFDLSAYLELTGNPDVAYDARLPESGVAVFVYFIFSLFLTGGVLEAYAADRKLTTSQFFEACGAFFWRWIRLFVLLLVVLVPLAFLGHALFHGSGRLMLNSVDEKTGYWMGLGVFLLTTFVAMIVRLWFDMAQVRTVVDDEHGMVRAALRTFRFTFANFGSLFWLYFRISFLAWLGLAAGLWLWAHIPGQRSGLSFLVLEIVLLWWIGTRLWQRASETVWYLRRAVAEVRVAGPEPLDAPSMGSTTSPLPQTNL
jgi:hypothetical protein